MGKLLLWLAVIAAVYLGYKLVVVSQRRSAQAGRRADERAAGALAGEPMRRCAHCGVYVPDSEATVAGDRHYCSEAHRDAGPRA
jgi:uncharacterized protein